MNRFALAIAAVLVALSGCAGMQVRKDQVTSAKKVAIVGYQGFLNLEDKQAKGGIAGAIGAAKGASDLLSGKLNARRVEQAEAGYAELGKRLSTTFGYAITDRASHTSSPAFSAAIQKTPNSGLFVVGSQYLPDVLRYDVVASMKPEARKALASELGVDALVAMKVKYEVGKTSGFAVAGMGKTTAYPVAVVEFAQYGADGTPIWHDIYARGQTATDGIATTMGAEIVGNESEVLAQALGTGLDAVMTRYTAAEDKK